MDVADAYVTFVRHSQDVLRDKVNEEMYIERLFDVSRCLLLLADQGGDPPKCDKIRDRRISHILRNMDWSQLKQNLLLSLRLRLVSVVCLFRGHLVWRVSAPICVTRSLSARRLRPAGRLGAAFSDWQRPFPVVALFLAIWPCFRG